MEKEYKCNVKNLTESTSPVDICRAISAAVATPMSTTGTQIQAMAEIENVLLNNRNTYKINCRKLVSAYTKVAAFIISYNQPPCGNAAATEHN